MTCRRLIAALIILPLLLSVDRGHASDYPNQSVRIINPFTAGGSLDTTGRLLANQLQEKWGKPVIVESRPGASTTIGIAAVANSAPNGYTLGLATNLFAMSAVRMKKLPYDAKKDIAAISLLVETPFMLVVRAGSEATTLDKLVELARRSPGQLNYASIGNGSSPHIAGELFKRAANIDLVHVPYKGAAPALQELLGGTTTMMFANVPDVVPYLEAGTLVAMATTDKVRSKHFPNVPTMAELGYPQIDIKSWYALVAQGATPPELIEQISRDAREAIKNPNVADKLEKLELNPVASTSAELKALILSEISRYQKLVDELGLGQLD
ncbi:Bug family tripartite tricarboxylate transporter substrate binding protein [Tardiphaga sp. 71_E8_N1_1]|uniref:Bug family tripartite tricarboxylate transporter substrate binding protein n=1 Tax=Tardiphaga sp. 71_E8_N1_1 TaxID=3240784 RepID=UPI003F8B9852